MRIRLLLLTLVLILTACNHVQPTLSDDIPDISESVPEELRPFVLAALTNMQDEIGHVRNVSVTFDPYEDTAGTIGFVFRVDEEFHRDRSDAYIAQALEREYFDAIEAIVTRRAADPELVSPRFVAVATTFTTYRMGNVPVDRWDYQRQENIQTMERRKTDVLVGTAQMVVDLLTGASQTKVER